MSAAAPGAQAAGAAMAHASALERHEAPRAHWTAKTGTRGTKEGEARAEGVGEGRAEADKEARADAEAEGEGEAVGVAQRKSSHSVPGAQAALAARWKQAAAAGAGGHSARLLPAAAMAVEKTASGAQKAADTPTQRRRAGLHEVPERQSEAAAGTPGMKEEEGRAVGLPRALGEGRAEGLAVAVCVGGVQRKERQSMPGAQAALAARWKQAPEAGGGGQSARLLPLAAMAVEKTASGAQKAVEMPTQRSREGLQEVPERQSEAARGTPGTKEDEGRAVGLARALGEGSAEGLAVAVGDGGAQRKERHCMPGAQAALAAR